MLTMTILLILFIGAYSGYKNGVIVGLFRAIGYTLTFSFAMEYYKALSEYIYLLVPYPSPFSPVDNPYYYYDVDLIFSLDQSYYYLVSILVILLVGWLITRLVTQLLSYFTEELIVPDPYDGVAGSILGFIYNYMAVFLLLFILSTIPYDFVQRNLSESWLADSMLTSTPNLSNWSYEVFIEQVHQKDEQSKPLMDIEGITNPEENSEEQEENNDE